MEHQKLFVDAAVGLRLNDFKGDATPAATRIPIVELMSKNNTRDTKKIRFLRPVLIHHMREFQRMPKKIDDSLSADQMMRALEGLNVNSDGNNNRGRMKEYFSSWTLELHKKLVEAVIQLGGLEKAIRAGGPCGILRLMDEERRRGLTEQMVKRRLWKLMNLQRLVEPQPRWMGLMLCLIWWRLVEILSAGIMQLKGVFFIKRPIM